VLQVLLDIVLVVASLFFVVEMFQCTQLCKVSKYCKCRVKVFLKVNLTWQFCLADRFTILGVIN